MILSRGWRGCGLSAGLDLVEELLVPSLLFDLVDLSDGQVLVIVGQAIGPRIHKGARSVALGLACGLRARAGSHGGELRLHLVGVPLSEELVRMIHPFKVIPDSSLNLEHVSGVAHLNMLGHERR